MSNVNTERENEIIRRAELHYARLLGVQGWQDRARIDAVNRMYFDKLPKESMDYLASLTTEEKQDLMGRVANSAMVYSHGCGIFRYIRDETYDKTPYDKQPDPSIFYPLVREYAGERGITNRDAFECLKYYMSVERGRDCMTPLKEQLYEYMEKNRDIDSVDDRLRSAEQRAVTGRHSGKRECVAR